METIFIRRMQEVKKNIKKLETSLKVKIEIKGRYANISGDSLDEYEASLVFEAVNFGFSVEKAIALKREDIIFRKIQIRDFTKRKNLIDVRSRIIGTEGRTKRTIENITGCDVIINDSDVGVIGDAESIESASVAISNLIRGSKQANVYKYLEDVNRGKKSKKELE